MFSRQPTQSGSRLPWTALPMALVALGAHYLTGASWIVPFSVVLLVGAQLGGRRFDNDAPLIRIGRYVLFAVLGFGAYLRLTSDSIGSSDANLAYVFGQFCAAEMAIQAWLNRPLGGTRTPSAVLLSTMVFLAASNTFDNRFIPFLTPLFFLCLGVALRESAHSDTLKRRSAAGSLALLLVVALGAGIHFGVYRFRNEISQWGMRFLEGKAVATSGLSTTPSLGDSFRFGGGLTRMMRAEGLPAFTYLRAMTFADYREGRWRPGLDRRRFENVPAATLLPNAPGHRARIERLVPDEGMICAPLNAAGLALPPAVLEWHRFLGPVRILIAGEADQSPFYTVVLSGEEHQGPLCVPPDANWRTRFLAVSPELDPRVRALAQRIGAGAKTGREKVRAVENYLMSHNAYSLNAHPGRGEKVSDFVLNQRSAHCEYFASAAVLMLRYLGVPSRYVIGYMAHEPDGKDALVVRGRDAHAWCESYVEGGWMTVDATPGGGRPDARAEALPFALKWREKIAAWLKQSHPLLEYLRGLPIGFWLGAVALLFAWLIIVAWKNRTKPALTQEFRYAARDAELAQISAGFENWLVKRALPCPPGRTWLEHARAADLDAATPFIRAYDEARFGPATQNFNDLKRQLHELENQHEPKP